MASLLAPMAHLTSPTSPTSSASLPLDREHLLERLRLTLVGAGMALLGIPVALVLAILWLVALPLSLPLIGLAIALAVVPAAQRLADVHRWLSGALLGAPIPSSYADTVGRSPLGTLWTWLRDPARWRDFAFLWFSATGGFALSLLPLMFLAHTVSVVIMLLVDGSLVWLLLMVLDGPVLVAWWLVTPQLIAARSRVDRAILGRSQFAELTDRVSAVEETRAATLDHEAAEMRRIERDLHDGAQARIAAVGMNVGLAEKLMGSDPEGAAALLREARETTGAALDDLRSVVRGIHPPALADRGLAGAVEALVVPIPIPVTVSLDVPRLPAPIESAAYFAVAECVTNLAKHSGAARAWIAGHHDGDRLHLLVGDDGRGGADAEGGGLTGIAARLGAFDGKLSVDSPLGGGTMVRMELPCQT